MLKYLAMVAAVVGSLMIAEQAQAFGRHGCKSCSTGGCPGGNCAVTYAAPAKTAANNNAPPGLSPAPQSAPAVVEAQPAPTGSYAYARRGLFGRR